uniref:THIF-type NAD/FAD binding fold domain-containing protein n=1 Tax=Alexandrium monilatum TaxID=311494 RepID=A0A7S4SRZ7_9DINO|mmetsp:Transcript_92534/g.276000  ORF Transcript_92534/g.276000 Transcript_92534/m.276000 type:complete len:347 (-) Transcript_92534:51-1091(-)
MAAISEGEVAVYDRQLRLWGVQAQQRLLNAKVLIWGLEGSNVETCKNLVLAGVALVVCDHRSAEAADVNFNYFLRSQDIGSNRAECAAERVREMNPLCTVSTAKIPAEEADSMDALRKVLQGYNFVLVAPSVLGWNFERICSIDAVCRETGVGFALTVGCGEIAFFFTDLGSHTVQERSSAQGSASAEAQGTAPEPETVEFPSFKELLGCSPADLQKRKVDASILLVALFIAFARSRPSGVQPDQGAAFQAYCRDSMGSLPVVDGLSDLAEAYRLFFLEPLVHVASIVGGLLTQEVIKAITARDVPLANCVCFNAHTGAALVERIPGVSAVSKKRKVEEVADILDD